MRTSNIRPFLAFTIVWLGFASASAQTRPPIVDSTGIRTGVIGTLVMPASGLSADQVQTIVQNATYPSSSTDIPPGYREVSVPMGIRKLGVNDAGLAAASYYYSLGYPALPDPGDQSCPTNGASVVYVQDGGTVCTGESSSLCSTSPTAYRVCEPQGTRTTLQKVIGATLLTLTDSGLAVNKVAGTIGVSTQAATAVCQAHGYTDYIPGSVSSSPAQPCDFKITRWNGTSFFSDAACYNPVMHSVQCWK